jgi:hypothetical protein
MISSPNIERNIELNFPLEKVKQDIERTVKNGAYAMHSKNDVLNTYRIGKITGLESITMNFFKYIDIKTDLRLKMNIIGVVRGMTSTP